MTAEPPPATYALGLEYDGSAFSGWQRQRHAPSVQQALETALGDVADQPVRTVAAGRTDAGVHATQQVVSFITAAQRPLRAWREGVNSRIGDSVKVRWARAVEVDFHARYSAAARRYTYLYRTDGTPSPLNDRLAWRIDELDADAMHQAGQYLVGEHDFTSFRAAGCQSRTSCRNVHNLRARAAGNLVVLDIQANAFLLHMVRNIAGALVQVGEGRRPSGWIGECLAVRDRRLIGKTAPANGLYLVDVLYPDHDFPAGGLPPPLAGLGTGLGTLDRLWIS